MTAANNAIAAAAPAVRSAAAAAAVATRGVAPATSTVATRGVASATATAAATAPSAAVAPAQAGAHAGQILAWLHEVPDPEIPVISITDLGIVRAVHVADNGSCDITITPTYSGCPAMQVIADAITEALHAHGIAQVRLHQQLSPAWTTDWLSEAGKAALKDYGIAPPAQQVIDTSALRTGTSGRHASAAMAAAAVSRRARPAPAIACPHCGSAHTELTSQFGSTPCKALYKCLDCREPFDYFKCH